ncbi:MAG: YybS family protein [Gammaproteobacteria bacterium]|nr:YybS family protein [Gammaproteobacteria bacterium]MDH5777147.1 YybS family protein [Gammaproteobacteria bacterium]
MRALASYIMRGQVQAITTVVVCAVFALVLIPLTWPLTYFSAAGVGLVALVQGPKESGKTVLGASLLTGLLTTVLFGNPAFAFGLAMSLWIPAWLFASLLQQTRSLAITLQTLLLVGVLFVIGMFISLGDPAAWWHQHLMKEVFPALEKAGLNFEKDGIDKLTQLLTGSLALMTCFGIAIGLFIARWWQSLLYHPGAFAEEFQELRLGRVVTIATLLLIAMFYIGDGMLAELAKNLLFVTLGMLLLQGLAVVHAVVNRLKLNSTWLVLMYVLLFVAVPFMMIVIIMLGLLDNGLDFRNRLRISN